MLYGPFLFNVLIYSIFCNLNELHDIKGYHVISLLLKYSLITRLMITHNFRSIINFMDS